MDIILNESQFQQLIKASLCEEKLGLDKYYTPDDYSQMCINIFNKVAHENHWEISQFIEPSAGGGSFSSKLDNVLAFDIQPEADNIHVANFLELDAPYREGRCVIGNPPFGDKLRLAQLFLKKASEIGDYIAFVLPMSQYKNNQYLANFELIASVALGDVVYSGKRSVKTCFNIYQRSKNPIKKEKANLNDVTIIRNDSPSYEGFDYDVRLAGWGTCRVLRPDERPYTVEYKIRVNNPEIKDQVIDVLNNANWKDETNSYVATKIQKFHIVNLLKREIPNIE